MFSASRAQLMRHVVEPHLAQRGIVLCDRFADSTTVYQGAARGLDFDFIHTMHDFTLRGRWPDLTLLLDLDVTEGFRRARQRNPEAHLDDRFEAESLDFHRRVRNGFRTLARQEPARWRIVDAAGTPEQVEQQIKEIVYRALG
jgi:dTMP kinase